MKIHIDTEGLKDMKWYEYALRFFFGGAMTVAAGIVATQVGPTVGGLFLAFPAIFPAGATLIDKHEKEKKVRAGLQPGYRGKYAVALDAAGATMGAMALVIFAVLVLKFLPTDTSSYVVLTLSALAWFCASVGIWKVFDHF
jgi:uncharacterized protein DUF3147